MSDLIHGRTADDTAPPNRLEAFRERRRQAVVGPQGNLALVNTQWITGDTSASQPVWGVPGMWAPLPRGVSGLRLSATAEDRILVDGELVDGTVMVAGMDALAPSSIRFSDTLTGTIIAGEGGEYALRVWDARSDAIRDFGTIDAFPYKLDWAVEATFEPIVGGGEVSIAHLRDEGATRQRALPGDICFEKHGIQYRLAAFQDGANLLLVFGDATNGVLTYSMGRFLRVAPREDGTFTLDFNRAYLPPCAFSYNFNCPIPPAQNRFPVSIEAGERSVLAKSGDLLH